MPAYRPIADVWILGRPKHDYYGAYPAGFLERARDLLGVSIADPVLHVCGGQVRKYPYRGLGARDKTLDVRRELHPDYCLDLTEITRLPKGFAAHLLDPPYTIEDAARYSDARLPGASALMRMSLESLDVGRRAGMLHYEWAACPPFAREVATVAVLTGRRQRARVYVVMEVLR